MNATPLQTALGLYLIQPGSRLFIEAFLALAAALGAVALRRGTRAIGAFTFVLISLGLAVDSLTPMVRAADVASALKAGALALFLFGAIRLGVEALKSAFRKEKVQFSTIFTDVMMLLLYGVVAMVVLRVTMDVDLTPLLATSAVASLVIGLGLQETLGNVFSGITLQLQKPFQPGDWVRYGEHVGRIVGTGWRATRLITREHEAVEIPNSLLAKELVINYSAVGVVADQIFIGLTRSEPPNRVEEVILELLGNMPEVLKEPRPEVMPWEYKDAILNYRIKFWLSDYTAQERMHTKVVGSLWYALRRHSIEIPYPIHTIFTRRVSSGEEPEAAREQRMLRELRRVNFLSGLSDDDLRMLIPTIRILHFGRGEVLMHEGEVGNCFHILHRGKVAVVAKAPDGSTRHINYLSAPDFFGEIALMTGEPRTATIRAVTDVEVAEVNRDGFAHLFKARPETANAVGDIIAARIADARDRAQATPTPADAKGGKSWLVAKMRSIFDF